MYVGHKKIKILAILTLARKTHYHQRSMNSRSSSKWDRVVPIRYNHQEETVFLFNIYLKIKVKSTYIIKHFKLHSQDSRLISTG